MIVRPYRDVVFIGMSDEDELILLFDVLAVVVICVGLRMFGFLGLVLSSGFFVVGLCCFDVVSYAMTSLMSEICGEPIVNGSWFGGSPGFVNTSADMSFSDSLPMNVSTCV